MPAADIVLAVMNAGGSIEEYLIYVINHEVGHSLSHPHEPLRVAGQVAADPHRRIMRPEPEFRGW